MIAIAPVRVSAGASFLTPMSIAVSVVVQASRRLAVMCEGLCCACAVLGLAFFLGAIPAISHGASLIVGSSCLICAASGWWLVRRSHRSWQLDIAGDGQIRLRHIAGLARNSSADAEKPALDDGLLVRLLADSTMWPRFLLLRLQDERGAVHHVAILPDSVSAESFRAISVACRWIAAHRFAD